jgi:hypothetical protein
MKFLFFSFFFISYSAHSYFVNEMDRDKVGRVKKLNLQMNGAMSSTSVNTKASDTTEATTASLTHVGFSPEVKYFLSQKLCLDFNYFSLTEASDNSQSNGYGLGVNYYFYGNGVSEILKLGNTEVYKTPGLSMFAGLDYKTRSLEAETLIIKFNGFHLKAGLDYHLNHHLFLTGSLGMDSLTSGETRTLTSTVIQAGLGTTY